MSFINRKEELSTFKCDYEKNLKGKNSQVYIIEANHGVGKTEFIREISKSFPCYPLEIYQSDKKDELSAFKSIVLELDKTNEEFGYLDFKTYFRRKTENTKALRLLLKITSCFGQLLVTQKKNDSEIISMITDPSGNNYSILNAQIENLYEYAEYVLSTKQVHIIFHNTSDLDSSSLNILCKLISVTKSNVYIFECDNEISSLRIERSLQNNHSVFLQKYQLKKLSNNHINTYIHQMLSLFEIDENMIDSSILKNSIDVGDLSEIATIIKDYSDSLHNNANAELRSIRDILQDLSQEQSSLLILIGYAKGNIIQSEIEDIIIEVFGSCNSCSIEYLLERKLIERNKDSFILLPFICQVLDEKDFLSKLKYAMASALVHYLYKKLKDEYNSRYVDVLVDYYLCTRQFYQVKTVLTYIGKRLNSFNTQAERKDYFQRFVSLRNEIFEFDVSLTIMLTKIAYNANLYDEANSFISLVDETDDEYVVLKALILNRCSRFEQSNQYIKRFSAIQEKNPSAYFELSLISMMNLIQLGDKEEAEIIYNNLESFSQDPLYPYLKRLSNVFYKDPTDRLTVVQSITDSFFQSSNNEYSGLHSIYLAYLYALTQQPELAEESLIKAREFFGDSLIYNHMILHNEATIKFHMQEIDEEIPILLNNAKITAFDEYDLFAINNNLLVYFILTNKMSSIECQRVVYELETMIVNTGFKRFLNIIHYNLYHYYHKMYNVEKRDYYKSKLISAHYPVDGIYEYKIMYETSWKLPILMDNNQ